MSPVARRKVCFITGSRADYGILFSVMQAVKNSRKLSLEILVTGMHLASEFGLTVREIKKDGFNINALVKFHYAKNDPAEMAQIFGQAVMKFTKVLEKSKPDLLVILGDREEMLAGAIVGNFLRIPIAHIHGGEISGHVDGIVRHAITKLSHLHFAATAAAKERIIKLGEEKWRVFLSGAPALDRIQGQKLPSKEELFRKYHLNINKNLIIVIQHPVLNEEELAEQQISATLGAVVNMNVPFLCIYPNSDAGGKTMIKIIENYRQNNLAKIFKSIPHLDYLGFLKYSSVLVGNSSSGIIEAGAFNLPVIDIGSRQDNREHGLNVTHVGYHKKEISEALRSILKSKRKSQVGNPYQHGNAGITICKVLERVPIDQKLLLKKMTY